jgi:putative ABC transport system substrate-binding protein
MSRPSRPRVWLITGVTQLNVEVAPKRLELAHRLLPMATIIAVLVNPTNPNRDP